MWGDIVFYRNIRIRTLMLAVALVALTIAGVDAGRALYRNWDTCRRWAELFEEDAEDGARRSVVQTMRYVSMSLAGSFDEEEAERERKYCFQRWRGSARAAWRAQHLRERMWQPWVRPLDPKSMSSRDQRE